MDLKQVVLLAFQVSILCTVFGFGLRASADDLLYLVRRPGLLLRSLLAVFVIMPVVAIALAKMFDFRAVIEIVLVALAVSPMPPLLPRKEIKAGGSSSYSLGLMAMLALLAIGAVPLSLAIVGRLIGRSFGMAAGDIARVVVIATLLPLLAGIAVRALLPGVAGRLEKPVGLLVKVLLPLAVVALLAGAWRAVWAAVGDGTVLAIVAFVVAGLLAGHLMGGPDPNHSVVLALSSACRHPAIALSIASTNFPGQQFGGAIILYVIVSTVVAIPYLAWIRRRH